MRCPCCEGNGQLPEEALETMVRVAAAKLGMVLRRQPAPREGEPAVAHKDAERVVAALNQARTRMGLGTAIYTGSPRQIQWIRRPLDEGYSLEHWEEAIEAQAVSLARSRDAGRLTEDEVSRYLSLQTIARNFDTIYAGARRHAYGLPSASVRVRLTDGTWAEIDKDGRKRILSEAESAGLT